MHRSGSDPSHRPHLPRWAQRLAVGWLAVGWLAATGCDGPITPLRPADVETRTRLVDYARDVRPILSEHCLACHGPDAAAREAGLRLDERDAAVAELDSGNRAIVPGEPENSASIWRARSTDPEARMPPGGALSARDLETLEIWIRDGASYERHWALVVPERPTVPSNAEHPVDAFLEARLAAESLEPLGPAAPATLLRRVTFDLSGLPPTEAELDAFLADPSESAYEAVVDRLLESDASAEHLAQDWLDYAGYGDSSALGLDSLRDMWPYRDWVIESFREARPIDDFIGAQLAGDTSTEPRDLLATGFLRNHPTIKEGGVIEEEYRIRYAMNRASAVGTQLLGLTVECAQCHDHRYDPVLQRDFYALTACFNRVGDEGNDAFNNVPTTHLRSRLSLEREAADLALAAAERDAVGDLSGDREAWEASVDLGRASWRGADVRDVSSEQGALLALAGSTVRLSGPPPHADTYVVELATPEPVRAIRFTGAPLEEYARLSEVTATVRSGSTRRRVRFDRVFAESDGAPIDALFDGDGSTFVEAEAVADEVVLVPEAPLSLDAGERLELRFDQLDGVGRIYASFHLEVSSDADAALGPTERAALQLRSDQRTGAQQALVEETFARLFAPEEPRGHAQAAAEAERRAAVEARAVAARVMRDDDPTRQTFVLTRGDYRQPTEEVTCALPEVLTLDAPDVEVGSRADLAAWIGSEDNAVTARLMASHYWDLVFAAPLLRTAGDLGTRAELPTHPALLDWLAVELRESGWDLRAYLRLLVTSAAYRRSARADAALREADPDNRWLARAQPRRLSVEEIRDSALSASGLLSLRIGGPSVRPYQPLGQYAAIARGKVYRADRGIERIHRRAMYTVWRRGALHPVFELLDAPARREPVWRREQTNTPTQALALTNAPLRIEAARALAAQLQAELPGDPDAQIGVAFRRFTSRPATDEELSLLRAAHDAELAEARADGRLGALAIGESDRSSGDVAAHRALTETVRILMNTSEALTRE